MQIPTRWQVRFVCQINGNSRFRSGPVVRLSSLNNSSDPHWIKHKLSCVTFLLQPLTVDQNITNFYLKFLSKNHCSSRRAARRSWRCPIVQQTTTCSNCWTAALSVTWSASVWRLLKWPVPVPIISSNCLHFAISICGPLRYLPNQ